MRERSNISQDFFSLTIRHSLDVSSYSGFIIGGVRFYTLECDFQCTTQNNEVLVVDEGSGSGVDNNFYSVWMKWCTFNIYLDDVLGYSSVDGLT